MVSGDKFEESVREETKGIPPQEVYVIELLSVKFGVFTNHYQTMVQAFSNLQMLVLNDCGLHSLDNFPSLHNLIRLDLVFNQLQDDCFFHLTGSRRLQCLMMGANQVKDIDNLKELFDHKDLIQLDLLNNPVQKVVGFRGQVFRMLPQLKVLDTLDQAGNDAFFSVSMADSAKRYDPHRFEPANPAPAPFGGFGGGGMFGRGAVGGIFGGAMPAGGVGGGIFGGLGGNHIAPLFPPALPIVKLKNKKQQKKLKDGLARTKSYDSMKGKKPIHKAGPMPDKPIAKGDKVPGAAPKRQSQSQRAGLYFPVMRITRKLRSEMPKDRVRKVAGVYTAAVLEYLTFELLENVAQMTRKDKKVRITEATVNKAIKEDPFFK